MLRFFGRPFRFLFSLKRLLILFSISLLIILIYGTYLDHVVVNQFEGKRFSLPAKVYARPLEIYLGKPVTATDLEWELNLLRYSKVSQLSGEGQYSRSGNRFYIHTRPFIFWDGQQADRSLELHIQNNTIVQLTDYSNGKSVDLARLDPYMMGGIYPHKNEDRELVRYEQLPRFFVDALVAVEDQRFYYHRGVDPRSLVRAFVTTLSGKGIQGGSTITQQLVKNFFLTPERTLSRKLKEMLMAVLLERRYEKNDILETYVNEVYFGQDRTRAIHGVALASDYYFGRNVTQMELHQAALLVAMLKGPAVYNPRRHPQRALKRRNLVLAELYQQGYIPEWQYARAKAKPLGLRSSEGIGVTRYPAFLDLVFRQLRQDYKESDLRSEGLQIFTTLDPVVQNIAEQSLPNELERFEHQRGLNTGSLEGAVVITAAQTGEVEALVGGRRVKYEGFNRALDAKRQVGSLMKPAIYVTALERPLSYTLSTILDDSPITLTEPGADTWEPGNFDQQFHGEVPLWLALAKSYNVSAARLGLSLGVDNVIATAHRLGIESFIAPFASSLLGASPLSPLEVAQMYQTLAANGFRAPLRSIREVLTLDGQPLKRYSLEVEQVLDPQTAYLITHGLQLVVEEGTAKSVKKRLSTVKQIAGKTGTTDGFRDSWFAGFTGDKVGVVWVGSDTSVNTHLTGASGAMQIWADIFAKVAHQNIRNLPPEKIVTATMDRTTGARVKNKCDDTILLPFIVGSEPQSVVSCHHQQKGENKAKKLWRRLFGSR